MKRATSMVSSVLVCGACGLGPSSGLEAGADPAAHQAIINGDLCDESVEPTAVAIMLDATISFPGQGSFDITQAMCTGTLIAPDVVVLAAHCLDTDGLSFGFGDTERADFYVTFEADLSRFAENQSQDPLPIPSSAIPASVGIPHPSFDLLSLGQGTSGVESDIGLLFLAAPITDVLPEVVITTAEAEQLAVGDAVTIAGWGQQLPTSQFEQPPAGSVGIKVCGATTIEELGTTLMQIGDAPETTRKCRGDSGGPTYIELEGAAIRRRVIGVTSRAYDQSDCNKGGVDTRIDSFVDWIDDEMRQGCENGDRVFCDVPGVLSEDDVIDLGAAVTGEGEGEGGEGGEGEGGGRGRGASEPVELANGCPGGCSSGSDVGLFGGAFVLLLWRGRRRQGQANG
jgi:hypothetical protein